MPNSSSPWLRTVGTRYARGREVLSSVPQATSATRRTEQAWPRSFNTCVMRRQQWVSGDSANTAPTLMASSLLRAVVAVSVVTCRRHSQDVERATPRIEHTNAPGFETFSASINAHRSALAVAWRRRPLRLLGNSLSTRSLRISSPISATRALSNGLNALLGSGFLSSVDSLNYPACPPLTSKPRAASVIRRPVLTSNCTASALKCSENFLRLRAPAPESCQETTCHRFLGHSISSTVRPMENITNRTVAVTISVPPFAIPAFLVKSC